MNYYIQYPIVPICNLRCYYCFHGDAYMSNSAVSIDFSLNDYKVWRDACISDAEEIWVEILGGETFIQSSFDFVEQFLNSTTLEKIELQTNGIQPQSQYQKLLAWKDRVKVIGFTYHRKLIDNIPHLKSLYINNVKYLRDNGIAVYVKELAIAGEEKSIIANKEYWNNENVEFRVQNFGGAFRGISGEYPEGWEKVGCLITPECSPIGIECVCRSKYKGLSINPNGSIIACPHFPSIVGNILKLELRTDFRINIAKGIVEYAKR